MVYFHVVFSVLIAWVTYYFNKNKGWGPVKASSFIALFFGGIYQLNSCYFHLKLDENIPYIAIGSTFIGMISTKKHDRNFHFYIAPLIFVFLYYNFSSYFKGFGGALGTAACISLVITIYLRSLKRTKRFIKPFRKLKIFTKKRLKLRRMMKR